ncbi:MAG: hypothetical protein LBT14_12135, partial [Treponema sp.]|nr:hypothetical protein [Treponema sp.]
MMRKSMKKLAMVLLALGMAVSAFAGAKKDAGNAGGGAAAKPAVKVGFVYIGSINDEGYTQAHDKGRLALQAKGIETAYIENVPENADCEKAIRDLIDLGCTVI